jgi:hypothetical protein
MMEVPIAKWGKWEQQLEECFSKGQLSTASTDIGHTGEFVVWVFPWFQKTRQRQTKLLT